VDNHLNLSKYALRTFFIKGTLRLGIVFEATQGQWLPGVAGIQTPNTLIPGLMLNDHTARATPLIAT